ncbi:MULTISPECIES: helix-turn-helix domain-containing protein [Pantoea]|jgi:putative transcriptional regulator|uniref:helix-turn-helix domain-containing protein n=1 Tax=Pantoea TaxID=53335 RepID=UPI0010C97997|nr:MULTISPECIES: helix-turn-helix domain-containing protein [Pantoea]MBD9644631.1 helix-turn-helix domain-containing protein [Pantoea sp. PNT02]MDR6352965.1 putative transcriptional regulator [Pantoea sp. SORGH_AS_0659]QCP62112.1 helix-turn-helix domain-containing protein [Pantoea sp. SO10]WFL69632.1 helix-turn-helix domain-containing protein [Pantoea sp. X85]
MVNHLKDLQEIARDFNEIGVVTDELKEKIDSRVRLRELRASLPVLHMMSGDEINQLRQRYNLSQAMLAAYVGMSVGTVVKWEREEKKPNGAALRLLNLIERKGLEVLQ